MINKLLIIAIGLIFAPLMCVPQRKSRACMQSFILTPDEIDAANVLCVLPTKFIRKKSIGKRKYRCLDCLKACTTYSKLAEHYLHRHSEQKLLSCPVCHKTAKSTHSRNRHIRIQHHIHDLREWHGYKNMKICDKETLTTILPLWLRLLSNI